MAKSKGKALFVVKKYPYNHPLEPKPVGVGSIVDLGHLPIVDRIKLVNRGLMEPTTEDALIIPAPEVVPEAPKLNKYGLPFGQVPSGANKENK